MNDNVKKIPVEELTLIFATVEDLAILADDLTTEYFDARNTDTAEGKRAILWDFNRARANMNAVTCIIMACGADGIVGAIIH